MRRIRQFCVLVLVLIVSGCVNLRLDDRLSIDDHDWYTEGGDEARRHSASTIIDPPLVEKWRYDLGAGVGLSGALVIDGVILVGTRKGHILALDLYSGKRIGRARFEAPIEGGMTFKNSLLYLPFIDKKRATIAYDIYKGDQVWRMEGSPVESSILANDSIAVIVDSDAVARGVSARTGNMMWENQIGEKTGIVASPVLVGENFIVATEEGIVHNMNPATGNSQWTKNLEGPVYSTPSVYSDNLFIPTTRGKFYSLSTQNGETNWLYSLADSTVRFASPAYDIEGNQLVFAGSDGLVRSLDPTTGEENWLSSLEGAIIIAPLITNNTIYIGTLRGIFYALDRTSGEKLWEHKVTGRIKSAMVAHDEKIIVMAETQQLFVFETQARDEVSP